MKKKFLLFFIVLMSVAMLGFIGIQVYWINNSLQLREANFRRSIDDAVNIALLNLETIIYTRLGVKQDTTWNTTPKTIMTPVISGDILKDSLDPEEFLIIRKPGIGTDELNVSGKTENSDKKHSVDKLGSEVMQGDAEGALARKQLMLNHLMNRVLDNSKGLHVEEIVNVGLIDTLLKQELSSRGISIAYEFGVYSPERNALMLERTGKYHEELLFKGFSFPLFSGAGIATRDFLLVYFPDQHTYNVRSLWLMMFISLLLILTIIIAFTYSVLTIIKQRKLSELKNDFINNMTHEFKTPISTISLACQALSDKDIPRTAEMYSDYIQIIGDENGRLGEMAEKILQTAILEKGTLHLRVESIDLHNLITDSIHKIAIQIEIRDGSIHTALNASQKVIKGDKVHLTNVVYNLLDNANKYSPRRPHITVSTADTVNGINISVQDHGLGINKANQKRIFEKLYRVPTGDVHNVKGFGLGLSYVKFIVEKHGGQVSVESEPGKGSTFTLFLPYNVPPTEKVKKE